MYALSWLFLAVAVGSLAFGLSQEGLTFIYVSIGASVLAMLFLLAGVLRKRPAQTATAGGPYGSSPEEAAPPATAATARPAPSEPAVPPEPGTPAQRAPGTTPPPTAPMPATSGPAAAPATRPAPSAPAGQQAAPSPATPAPEPAPTEPAAPSSQTADMVMAIPDRGTYHLATCRYVRGRQDAERLQRETAKQRGYNACGVCRPG